MKRIIIVFANERDEKSTRYVGFGRRLQKSGVKDFKEYEILTVALENLTFIVDEDKGAHVVDANSGIDLSDASFVYLKEWSSLPDEASVLASYLFYRGVQFADTLPMGKGVSKLSTIFKMWANEINVPLTIYAGKSENLKNLIQQYGDTLGEKFILKSVNGAKGADNYLVTAQEALTIIDKNPNCKFICQRFIQNDGDWRIGVYMDHVGFAIKRTRANNETHLNNTSAGGSAEYFKTNSVPAKVRGIAKRAAHAAELQISGVDVIEEKATGKAFILEVNQGSQIVTGAFARENIKGFTRNIVRSIAGQYVRDRNVPMKLIGRRVTARLADLGVRSIIAKVDTGAYSSTLHAENICVEDGVLKFDIMPSEYLITKDGNIGHYETKDFSIQKVRSSSGHVQERYSIRTRVSIRGRAFPGIITLSDRSEMGYPFLIGRRLIRSRFLVNVELDESNQQKWSY